MDVAERKPEPFFDELKNKLKSKNSEARFVPAHNMYKTTLRSDSLGGGSFTQSKILTRQLQSQSPWNNEAEAMYGSVYPKPMPVLSDTPSHALGFNRTNSNIYKTSSLSRNTNNPATDSKSINRTSWSNSDSNNVARRYSMNMNRPLPPIPPPKPYDLNTSPKSFNIAPPSLPPKPKPGVNRLSSSFSGSNPAPASFDFTNDVIRKPPQPPPKPDRTTQIDGKIKPPVPTKPIICQSGSAAVSESEQNSSIAPGPNDGYLTPIEINRISTLPHRPSWESSRGSILRTSNRYSHDASIIEDDQVVPEAASNRNTLTIPSQIPLPLLPIRKERKPSKSKSSNIFRRLYKSFRSIFGYSKPSRTAIANAQSTEPEMPPSSTAVEVLPQERLESGFQATEVSPFEKKSETSPLPDLVRRTSTSITAKPETLRVTPNGLMATNRVVWLTTQNDEPKVEAGTVKWVGRIRGALWAGVELDNRVGNSSGIHGYGAGLQVQLFTCKLGFGRFIRVQELMLYSEYYQGSGIICVICNDDFIQPDDVKPAGEDAVPGGEVERSRNMTATKCGHLFHSGCLSKWFETNKKDSIACPYCFKDILKTDVIRIYPAQVI